MQEVFAVSLESDVLVVTETPRLLVRHWQPRDLQAYGALIGEEAPSNPDEMSGEPCNQAENELWRYQAEQDKWGWSRWAVVSRETHELVGYCGFAPYGKDVEMSWRFLPEFRGLGLIVEVARAVAEHGLQQLGFNRIISFTSPDNEFAQDVMQHMGMTLDCFEGWSTCTVARYSLKSSL